MYLLLPDGLIVRFSQPVIYRCRVWKPLSVMIDFFKKHFQRPAFHVPSSKAITALNLSFKSPSSEVFGSAPVKTGDVLVLVHIGVVNFKLSIVNFRPIAPPLTISCLLWAHSSTSEKPRVINLTWFWMHKGFTLIFWLLAWIQFIHTPKSYFFLLMIFEPQMWNQCRATVTCSGSVDTDMMNNFGRRYLARIYFDLHSHIHFSPNLLLSPDFIFSAL